MQAPFIDPMEADAILEAQFGTDAWFTLDEATKAKLLQVASSYLRLLLQEALPDVDPETLADSVALEALYLYENREVMRQGLSDRALGVQNKSLGSMSLTRAGGYSLKSNFHPQVLLMLRKHIRNGIRLERV
ncbi:hypothetical protein [Desulfocurvibacter africanus]|uniref:hypothetical protein n=1 Tax=Desulfocurvibacter africanus TaxID=873 RepID=UPI00042343A5|nr:hypothetical protein [Desulfocurvibacter africanus]